MPPRSVAEKPLSAPPKEPNPVRTPERNTSSGGELMRAIASFSGVKILHRSATSNAMLPARFELGTAAFAGQGDQPLATVRAERGGAAQRQLPLAKAAGLLLAPRVRGRRLARSGCRSRCRSLAGFARHGSARLRPIGVAILHDLPRGERRHLNCRLADGLEDREVGIGLTQLLATA